ncbi:MAG: asparagine synthetase B family protein [Rhizomicrobium sp.]
MCGIAVAIDWDDADASVRALSRGVLHRGDVSDPVVSPRPDTAMATRRLRVVDSHRAVQPQASFDGRLLVSFNGEIYNHDEIRRELSALGVTSRTESDTEVLANALQMWGAGAFARLNGMFAFVAIDVASGDFLAARDPFGVKPLYVVQSQTGFLFCSEIRPLLEVAPEGDVLLLPPGYMLTRKICAGYKSALLGPFEGRSPGDAAMLDALLAEAVRTRLPRDLPVATMLSGGIDSTLVAHYARRFRPDAPAYFLGGEDTEDFRFAAAYADKSGTMLRVVPFDGAAALARLDEAVAQSETFEPAVIRAAVCSLTLSQAMHRDGFRVALCGEGADELFAGYAPLEQAFDHSEETGRTVRNECLDLMHRTCLQRIDRCAMRYQLEAREPFLDPAIAAYALNLRGSALVDGQGKKPLRALYDLYPDELPAIIRDRRKVPFGEDLDEAFWSTFFESTLTEQDFRDGQREFALFAPQTREEVYCLRTLSRTMDIFRVPHLRGRPQLSLPLSDAVA